MPKFSVSVLHIRDFRLMLFARILGMMALQAQDVVIGWQVYSITRDPLMLGLVGLTEAVPAILCALIAGHIVDISRPHRVFLIALGAIALNSCFMASFAAGFIAIPHQDLLFVLFGGIFISGLARSFIMPSSYALLSQIIPRNDIAGASAFLSSGFQIAAISGPAIAGLLYGGYGERVAWLIPGSLLWIAFIMLAGLSFGPRHWRSTQEREKAVKSIKAGWCFILTNPVLLSVMALDMFAMLFGGAAAMLPAYADQVLHVGSEGLGALRAAPAMGAVVTAIILALYPMRRIRALWLIWVASGFGLCIIGFGFSTHFMLSMAFLIAGGAVDSVSMVMRSTLMQWLTPDEMRGRVSSVNSMFIISSNEIGAFESGLAAKLLGLVPSVVFGGCMTLVIAGLTAALSPKFRRTVVDAESGA